MIAALQVDLAERDQSIPAMHKQNHSFQSKTQRRVARKMLAEQKASAAKADFMAVSEKLTAAKVAAKQAKKKTHIMGVVGLSASSSSGSDTDDELDSEEKVS